MISVERLKEFQAYQMPTLPELRELADMALELVGLRDVLGPKATAIQVLLDIATDKYRDRLPLPERLAAAQSLLRFYPPPVHQPTIINFPPGLGKETK